MSGAILSAAVALPQLRLAAGEIRGAWGGAPRGLRRKAVCAFDEDAITLAVEAARAACESGPEPGALFLGATTLPYEERPAAASLATALTGRRDLAVHELRGSGQAGLQALVLAGLWTAARGVPALAVLADAPEGPEESALGQACAAGAAAFLVGPGPGRAELGAAVAATAETFGHRFRRRGASRLSDLELRTDPDAAPLATLARAERPAGARLAGALAPRLEARVAKTLGAEGDGLWPDLGDAGAASAGLALAHRLDTAQAGETVLALAFGGGATLLPVRATGAGPGTLDLAGRLAGGREVDYLTYLKHRRAVGPGREDGA